MRKITIADTKMTDRHKQLVNEVLDSERLTYGPKTIEFEKRFAELHDRKIGLFANSGTSALQVAIHAMKETYGWKDGDEVIVPALTFPATINVVIQNNLEPVFVDVDVDYFDLKPALIEPAITKKTRAIIPVHLLGQSADMVSIMKIAKNYKLKVIEDSCETYLVNYQDKPVGSMGDIACYSTYLAHIISTVVGGLALTNDKELAVMMRSLIWHGRDKIYLNMDDDNDLSDKNLFDIVRRRFSFDYVGYSYRATEMEAALGLAELEVYKDNISKRQENAEYLSRRLKFNRFVQTPKTRKDSEHCWMFYPLKIYKQRDGLIEHLEKNGIETRYLMPITNQPVYWKYFRGRKGDFPIAEHLNDHGILVGCHQYLGKEELDYIADRINEFYE